jgi:hypothetical protein
MYGDEIRFLDYAGTTESLKPKLFNAWNEETKSKLVCEDKSFWTTSQSELADVASNVVSLASATFFNAKHNSL